MLPFGVFSCPDAPKSCTMTRFDFPANDSDAQSFSAAWSTLYATADPATTSSTKQATMYCQAAEDEGLLKHTVVATYIIASLSATSKLRTSA